MFSSLTKLLVPFVKTNIISQIKTCYSVFGIHDLIMQEKPEHITVRQVNEENREKAMEMIKRHYLTEHVLVRARNMDLSDDRALDEYLIGLIKQGNTMLALAEDGNAAAICVGFASSPVDPKNLRNYAFYRQDPNTKDFLYFIAKLQETPNLWETFRQEKIFEIKMLAVVPEFRRQGLAVMLAEKAKEQAHDQGFNVVRMDCINPYENVICKIEKDSMSAIDAIGGIGDAAIFLVLANDVPGVLFLNLIRYKVAERCMMQCIVKFPLHKLRGTNAPFVRRSSKHNCCVRVYIEARSVPDVDVKSIKEKQPKLECLIE